MDTAQQLTAVTKLFHEKVAAFLRPEQAEDYMGAGVLPQHVMDSVAAHTKKELGKSFSLRHPWLTGIPTLGIAPGIAKSKALDNIYRNVLRNPEHAKLIQGRWAEKRKTLQEDRMHEAKAREAEAKWEQAQQMRAALTEAAMQAASAYKHKADLEYGSKGDNFGKTAAIYGAQLDPLAFSPSSRVPMDYRLGLAQEYLDKKKDEKPTNRFRALLGGAGLGAAPGAGLGTGLGALLSAISPRGFGSVSALKRGGAKGGVIGGGIGALLGLTGGALASSIDRGNIREAKHITSAPPDKQKALVRKLLLEGLDQDAPGDIAEQEAEYSRRLLKKRLGE